MKFLLIFLFCFTSSVYAEQTNLYELVQPEAKVYPVGNYQESQIVAKCDTQRTKRRAMMWSAHNLQKKNDNEWKATRLNASLKTTKVITTNADGKEILTITTEPTEITRAVLDSDEARWERLGDTVGHAGSFASVFLLPLLLK